MKRPTGLCKLKFSLRTMLVAVTAMVIWMGIGVHHARQQKMAIAAIESVDGYYYYDYQYDPPETFYGDRPPPGPAWLWRRIDQNLFFDVVAVGLNSKPANDETLHHVAKLGQLQLLDLAAAESVTSKGLKHLESLRKLTYLRLDGTSIENATVVEYQRTHPAVNVIQ